MLTKSISFGMKLATAALILWMLGTGIPLFLTTAARAYYGG